MVDEVMMLEGADGDWRSRSRRLSIIVILIDSSSQIVFYS